MKPSLVIVGLGNVGKAYADTRHNVGFLALDALQKQLGTVTWSEKQKFLAQVGEAEFERKPVLLVKPTTYMNLSGQCVRKLIDFYKLQPSTQLLVCCDDIDLALGTHRFRTSGGPGTHNGLKSIVEAVGEGFPRLRIGLGRQPEGADLAAWVLSRLPAADVSAMQPCFDALPKCMHDLLAAQSA